MKKLHPLAFAALTLPLILAACGTAATPTAGTPSTGKLVKLSLHAPAGMLARTIKPASSIKTLGLPTDPTNAIPALHFDVHVRDSNGALVAFNDSTYDPSGAGSTTVVLNSQNGFGQTLLLPEGQYTFENAVKDDAGSSTLLAYGPANENGFAVSGDGSAVLLKFHAVYDPAGSALDFSTNTPHLFTNTTFNLNLFAKSNVVNGTSYKLPTTDLGPVTYTLGNSTDGILNGAGSKLGVNLTAVGTPTDSTLDVTASFNAWIQDGAETASFQSTTLNFSKMIESNAMGADTVMPVVGFNAVAPATVGQAVTLSGTATDNQMVGSIKLYDNLNLVASSDSDDGVAAVTSDASGTWSTDWSPMNAGSHDLTVIVADSSGNETHSTQTVMAIAAIASNYDHEINWADGTRYIDYTLAPNSESIVKVDTNGYMRSYYAYVYARTSSDISGVTATYGPNLTDQHPFGNSSGYHLYDFPDNMPVSYIRIQNTNNFPVDIQVYAND